MPVDKHASDYLTSLATDPAKLAAFKADPQAALKAAKLSPAATAAILSKDPAKIRNAIGGGQPGGAVAADSDIVVVVII
jgi:hypothetical protein